MTTDPIQLLRSLALGSRGAPQAQQAQSADSTDFAELLRQAQAGEISSKLPVTIDPDVDVEISDKDLAKLSLAADKAEASGLRTALVIANGKRLILDVQQRRITSVASGDSGIVGGVDGIIDLSARAPEQARGIFGPLVLPGSESPAPRPKSVPSSRTDNASVLNLLSQLRKAQ